MTKRSMYGLAFGTALVGALAFTQAAGPKITQGAGQRDYKLAGAWIGKGAGTVWTSTITPNDSAENKLSLRVKFQTYSDQIAALAAAFGADAISEFVGPAVMNGRASDDWTLVGYALAQGNPPQIKGIMVGYGTATFTDENHGALSYTMEIYPAAADADSDGMPDPGTLPVITLPDLTDTLQRVPLLK